MRRALLAFVLCLLSACVSAQPARPLLQAHSHNDYEHARPLWDALDQGFCGVEADIYLVNGRLLVAHNLEDTRPDRTLEKLYLEPLRQLVRKNGGRVYPDPAPVTLLIDIKSEADGTWAVLEPLLSSYAPILTRFRDGKIETNAVTVILSGNRPRERLLAEKDRLAAFDGRLSDLGKGLPVAFMPLVSDNFAAAFPSAKSGALSAEDRAAFERTIQQAHSEGRAIRFWATADDRAAWKMLRSAGVDFINTDHLAGLAAFLREQ